MVLLPCVLTRVHVLFLELKPTGNLAAIYAFAVLAGLINAFVRILQNSTILSDLTISKKKISNELPKKKVFKRWCDLHVWDS